MLVIEYVGADPDLLGLMAAYLLVRLGRGDRRGAFTCSTTILFFSMAFAIKTYFQRSADPAGHLHPPPPLPFTINHIAPVFLTCPRSAICGSCRPAGSIGWPLAWRSAHFCCLFLIPPHSRSR